MVKTFLTVTMLCLVSLPGFTCGLHQATGFHLTTEPGSLEVFSNVIDVRQRNLFNNISKPDHFRLFALNSALNKPAAAKINFTIFEAIKGHYSLVDVQQQTQVTGRDTLPNPDDLMIITELDILDALATGKIGWLEAKQQKLVALSGPKAKQVQLDDWFQELFEAKDSF